MNKDKNVSIYVHMPFCVKKCKYCDFVSFSDEFNVTEAYANAVKKEFFEYELTNYTVKTVFFGGGTPSSVKPEIIGGILDLVRQRCSVADDAEITLECNPCTLTEQKLLAYKNFGVNRLSIGVQSFDDAVLKTLGRVHDSATAENAIRLAKNVGFQNISIDLMFSIPGQTEEVLCRTLKKAAELLPQHISLYSLILEDETELTRLVKDGALEAIDDDTDRHMYRTAVDFLNENGYKQYEISNFAKSGYESRHNVCYWERGEYVGLGCAAHSFFNGVRYSNTEDLHKYIAECDVKSNVLSGEKVLPIDAAEETVMLGLRMNRGFTVQEFKDASGIDFFQVCGGAVDELVKDGLIKTDGKSVSVTDKGRDLLNTVILKLSEKIYQ